MKIFHISSILLLLLFSPLYISSTHAAPKAELWPRWQNHAPESKTVVNHSSWQNFLAANLKADHSSGINLVRYASVTKEDREALKGYVNRLESVSVSKLNRAEQKAYWINLYNALTVQVILENYPVPSIMKIDISPGWFTKGPWGAKLVKIEKEALSLDDIEHRILRPIWKDPRVHYAVNCASLGCPNLQPQAFTAGNTEELLEKGAREFINHPRGANLTEDGLELSSIYKWFSKDFGKNRSELFEHLGRFAEPDLETQLRHYQGSISYDYDWNLNIAED